MRLVVRECNFVCKSSEANNVPEEIGSSKTGQRNENVIRRFLVMVASSFRFLNELARFETSAISTCC